MDRAKPLHGDGVPAVLPSGCSLDLRQRSSGLVLLYLPQRKEAPMPIRNILIPIYPDVAADAQLEAALPVARHLNGHINAVYVHPDSTCVLPAQLTRDAARISNGEREREAEAAAQAKAKEAFELWRTRHGLPSGPLYS